MARTINGKLTGRAAATEARELHEYLAEKEQQERIEFSEQWHTAIERLQEIDPEFVKWFWSRPEQTKGEMLPLMEQRIVDIEMAMDITQDVQLC